MNKNYPKLAVPLGTIVRSKKLNRLGVVVNAFYDEERVLNYTCFFVPHTAPGMYHRNLINNDNDEVQGIMYDETEFDLIFYLMVGKVNLEELDIYHVPGELVL